MAGIGFELRNILRERNLTSILRAFGYSAMLSSGPYFVSILSIILAGWLASMLVEDKGVVRQFQVSVTYLIAFSLIFTGASQLLFTRYISDVVFLKRFDTIMPNFIGVVVLNMIGGFVLCLLFVLYAFRDVGFLYGVLFLFNFTTLCGVWMTNILLTSLKSYRYILYSFACGYGLFVGLSFLFVQYGLNGLMFSFLVGQSVLFAMLAGYIIYSFRSDILLRFDFTDLEKTYPSLVFTGFFYNLGVWADKFVFWFNQSTSQAIIGPLRASALYDIPVFLAYLTIAPGMASLFLKLEGEFAEIYDRYYKAVREGATLDKLYDLGDEVVDSARTLILDVMRIQAIGLIFVFIFEFVIFRFFGLSLLYIPLFNVLSVGTFLQLLFIAILSLAFYFDRRKEALLMSATFVLLNLSLSQLSILLGPYFYGYGFVLSLFFTNLMGIILLRRFLYDIHYQTFMLR